VKTYKIGIVGAGFGVKAHLPALMAHPRFEVVALASPKTAKTVAAERGIPHAFPSCEAMLAGCELDAITIASPPFTHERDVIDSLAHGLNVICEKPFALTVAAAQDMVDAAARAGTACGVAHEFRFVPQIQAMHQLVANHHLDPLRTIEVTGHHGWLRKSGTRSRGWWFDRELGGGLTGAWLSHLIDQSNWLAGRPPQRSTGYTRTANVERTDAEGTFTSTVDDGGFAILDYGDGLIGRLTADATLSVESYLCSVHGEGRTAVASGKNITELTLYTIDDEETNELDCKPSPYAKFETINGNVPLLMELYDEFIKQIETGTSDLPTFTQALATQRVLASLGFATGA
jgi:predicted dehydrogenase